MYTIIPKVWILKIHGALQMIKSVYLTSIAAAISIFAGSATADSDNGGMEKCTVTDSSGKGLIKAHQGACQSATSSCSGQNAAGDPNAWILVPAGECQKINAGDLSGLDQSVIDKIDVSGLPQTNGTSTNGTTGTTDSSSTSSSKSTTRTKSTS